MKTKDADRRTRRTKALLRQTLTALLLKKDLKDITVSELTRLADINRGTFYLHYKDIYDLFDQTEKEIMDDFTAIIAKHMPKFAQASWLPMLLEAFRFIADNADVFMAILRTRETTFLSNIIELTRRQSMAEWRDLFGPENEAYYEYFYTFITSGCVAMLRRWFSLGMPESPERMAELAEQMMMNVVKGLARPI